MNHNRFKDEKQFETEYYRVMKKFGVERPEDMARMKVITPKVRNILIGASAALVTGTFLAYQ